VGFNLIITEATDADLEWANEVSGGGGYLDDAVGIVLQRGEHKAVIVYDCNTYLSSNMHIASNGSKMWLTRKALTAAFVVPFVAWDCKRLNFLVPISKPDVISFCQHVGGREEGRLREAAADGGDVMLLGMLRRDCRWIPKDRRI
jgi:hypothetical protein